MTGASSGLGLAFAQMLLADGVEVWGSSRRPSGLEALVVQPSARARFHAFHLDLGEEAGALASLALAEQQAGGAFDLVILNAGAGVFGAFDAFSEEVWSAQLSSLVLVQAALARRCFSGMRRKATPSALVVVSSMAVEFPIPFMAGYNMAKAAQAALAASLGDEALGSRVSVLDFRPSDHRTAFNQSVRRNPEPDAREQRVWGRLEAELEAAPPAQAAARDLRRALSAGRRGVLRSGSFFQVRLARLAAAVLPPSCLAYLRRRHFDLRVGPS